MPLMTTLQQEMDRELTALRKADPPAYYLGYTLTDNNRAEGPFERSHANQPSRPIPMLARRGGAPRRYDLDNTHRVGSGAPAGDGSYGEAVPIEDDAGVLRRAMWRQTDEQYRAAAEALIKVETSKDVEVQTAEQRALPLIFPRETPNVFYGPQA